MTGSSATSSASTPGKQFVCAVCQQAFQRGEHLRRHERARKPSDIWTASVPVDSLLTLFPDTKKRPYTCSDCGASYGRTDVLVRHQRKCPGRAAITEEVTTMAVPSSSDGTPTMEQRVHAPYSESTSAVAHSHRHDFLQDGSSLQTLSQPSNASNGLSAGDDLSHPVSYHDLGNSLSDPFTSFEYPSFMSFENALLPDLDHAFALNLNIPRHMDSSRLMPSTRDQISPSFLNAKTGISQLAGSTRPFPWSDSTSTSPSDRTGLSTVEKLAANIKAADKHMLLRDFKLPSESRVRRYINAYWDYFDPHTPIIHWSTFNISESPRKLLCLYVRIFALTVF